jgi:DNA-binding cell septation regulator SpoVG
MDLPRIRQVRIRSPLVVTDLIPVTVVDTNDGKYTARWSPRKTGEYTIEVIFGDGLHPTVQNFTSDLVSATPEMYQVTKTPQNHKPLTLNPKP